MFHDILVPYKVGNYYLFQKKVLSFEISPMMVQGVLMVYSGKSITIKNSMSIILKDFSAQSQIGALKKIASTIGAYDEVVTSLVGSAVSFKELTLPFLGRDKLEMIVAYEVEAYLPFSIDAAAIEFIIIDQNIEKKTSTVLIAAVRKEDIDAHYELFMKAEISLSLITLDLFALHQIYRWGIYNVDATKQDEIQHKSATEKAKSGSLFLAIIHKITLLFRKKEEIPAESVKPVVVTEAKAQKTEMMIDVGFDVVRVLYLQDGALKAVRMIPSGVSEIAQTISKQTGESFYDVAREVALGSNLPGKEDMLEMELKKLFDVFLKTLNFFEKQEAISYQRPSTILFSGLACKQSTFRLEAEKYLSGMITFIDIKQLCNRLSISMASPHQLDIESTNCLALALYSHFEPDINYLKSFSAKIDNNLLNKQLLALLCFTILSIGGAFWMSFAELKKWENSYKISKKQLSNAISANMDIDLSGVKSIKDMIEKAEETFKKEKALWFSFSKHTEKSFLEYLQDLSIHIDRAAIGLDVRHMHLDYEKVTIVGSVKEIENIQTFEDELMELQFFTLDQKPREQSFVVSLTVKNNEESAK